MAIRHRKIVLEDLEIVMSIGIHEHEQRAPQRVLVDVEVYLDPAGIDHADAIEAVLDYDLLRNGITALANERHYNLQETFCRDILRICTDKPGVRRVRVHSRKPDVYPDCKSVGYEIDVEVD